jgi:threonine/homoserine/homoserine lactone efflux protein
LSLAATGAAFGARRGLGYLVGIVIGNIGVMGIVASGVTGVMLAAPGVAPIVTGLAGAYIVYLAWRIATAPPLAESTGAERQPSILGGVFLSLVNPKAYAVMAALFSSFVLVGGSPHLDAALKAAILVSIMAPLDVAWLLLGAALTRCFRAPGINRAINLIFAALLVASLAFALVL